MASQSPPGSVLILVLLQAHPFSFLWDETGSQNEFCCHDVTACLGHCGPEVADWGLVIWAPQLFFCHSARMGAPTAWNTHQGYGIQEGAPEEQLSLPSPVKLARDFLKSWESKLQRTLSSGCRDQQKMLTTSHPEQ